MAQIPNTSAFSEGDGLNTYVNIDTVNKVLQLLNGATLKLYSDGGATQIGQINNPSQSATAAVIANNGTISTAGVGVARVAPAGAVTGIILQAGALPGQEVWVVNESAAANTVTLNTTPATSNVADSATESAIAGLKARKYVWDSSTSLWYPAS